MSIFNTNSDSSSIHKPSPELLKYLNKNEGMSLKQQLDLKQEGWMYQGGTVEDEKEEVEYTEFVEAEEIMEVHERGEKANSDDGEENR